MLASRVNSVRNSPWRLVFTERTEPIPTPTSTRTATPPSGFPFMSVVRPKTAQVFASMGFSVLPSPGAPTPTCAQAARGKSIKKKRPFLTLTEVPPGSAHARSLARELSSPPRIPPPERRCKAAASRYRWRIAPHHRGTLPGRPRWQREPQRPQRERRMAPNLGRTASQT